MVSMLVGLLTGCAGSSAAKDTDNSSSVSTEQNTGTTDATTEEAASDSSTDKTTIEFWNVFTGSDGDILREIVDTYNSTNTDNIVINMDIMPNATLQEKLPAAIATGTAPDLVLFGVENIAPYVSSSSLTDISDFWDTTGVDQSNYLESVTSLSLVDGKLYGTPMQYNVQYLYWNKDLFTAAGLDPETPPATLTELEGDAVKLTDTAKNQYGLALPTDNNVFVSFLWGNGGDVDDSATAANLLKSDANLQTLNWMQNLSVNEKVSPGNITSSDAEVMFQSGQIAMFISGPWQINGLRNLGINFGVTSIPAGTAGAYSPAGGCSYVIPSGTEESQKLAAYKFMQYWLTDEILKEWSNRNGFPVWSKTLMEDAEIKNDAVLSAVSKATEIGRSYNLGYAKSSQIDNDAIVPMFEKVLTGSATPEDALNEASDTLDSILAQ
jgi:multiple sugar transport system substrate-binding protein